VFTKYLPDGRFVNKFYELVYQMTKSTRDNLLEKAELLFSQKGFNGTSIKDVSAEVNVSKQGLLHHFPTKEKLYAAVLDEAALYISSFVNDVVSKQTNSKLQLVDVFESLLSADGRLYRVIVLLMRELLDNQERADTSNKWYLRPFLDQLAGIAKTSKEESKLSNGDSLALIYHLLGSTQYFLISQTTLSKILSKEEMIILRTKQKELIIELCK